MLSVPPRGGGNPRLSPWGRRARARRPVTAGQSQRRSERARSRASAERQPAGCTARSGANGSDKPPLSSSRPWAIRVAFAGTGGSRAATTRSALSTSSGRTAGVVCRTTTSSIPHGGAAVVGCRMADRWSSCTVADTIAARASIVRIPCLVRRSTSTTGSASVRSTAAAQLGRPTRRRARSATGSPRRGRRASRHRRPRPPRARRGRAAWPRPACATSSAGSSCLDQLDLDVLRLARHAGRRGADPGDLRVRVEALRVRHGHVRPAQRPLERARDVAVGGEPQPAALGVAQPQLLHRRGRGVRAGPAWSALLLLVGCGYVRWCPLGACWHGTPRSNSGH